WAEASQPATVRVPPAPGSAAASPRPPPAPGAPTAASERETELGQALAASRGNELPVPNAFDRQQLIRDRPDAPRRATQRDDLEAGVLVEMDVQARGDRAKAVVLDVGELVGERVRLVIVDERQHAHRLARQRRPLFLHQLTTEKVAHEFAAVTVPTADAQPAEGAHQPRRQ